jgi:trans-aconitate methyltransferase
LLFSLTSEIVFQIQVWIEVFEIKPIYLNWKKKSERKFLCNFSSLLHQNFPLKSKLNVKIEFFFNFVAFVVI